MITLYVLKLHPSQLGRSPVRANSSMLCWSMYVHPPPTSHNFYSEMYPLAKKAQFGRSPSYFMCCHQVLHLFFSIMKPQQLQHKRLFHNVFVLFVQHLSGCFQDLLGGIHQCELTSSPKGNKKNLIPHLGLFKMWCVKKKKLPSLIVLFQSFEILDSHQNTFSTFSFLFRNWQISHFLPTSLEKDLLFIC